MNPRLTVAVLGVALMLVGCAKRPVLFPNERFEELGEPAAEEIITSCMEQAREADVADSRTAGASRGAAFGSAVGAVIGGIVGFIFGDPGRGAAAGAASGGGRGAVGGASRSGEGADTFRNFVDVCLRREGLQPIGWR